MKFVLNKANAGGNENAASGSNLLTLF